VHLANGEVGGSVAQKPQPQSIRGPSVCPRSALVRPSQIHVAGAGRFVHIVKYARIWRRWGRPRNPNTKHPRRCGIWGDGRSGVRDL
jgi:hypothetical protein